MVPERFMAPKNITVEKTIQVTNSLRNPLKLSRMNNWTMGRGRGGVREGVREKDKETEKEKEIEGEGKRQGGEPDCACKKFYSGRTVLRSVSMMVKGIAGACE